MNRAERRRLERLGDRALARSLDAVRGMAVPTDGAVIALDGQATAVTSWPAVRAYLELVAAAELANEIEAERCRRGPFVVPVVVVAGGHVSVAWTRALPVSSGGDA